MFRWLVPTDISKGRSPKQVTYSRDERGCGDTKAVPLTKTLSGEEVGEMGKEPLSSANRISSEASGTQIPDPRRAPTVNYAVVE